MSEALERHGADEGRAAKPDAGAPAPDWKAAIEALPVPILVLSAGGLVETANPACRAFWKLRPAEVTRGTALRAFLETALRTGDKDAGMSGLREIERCERSFRENRGAILALGAPDGRRVAATLTVSGTVRLLSFAEEPQALPDLAAARERAGLVAAVLDELPHAVYVKDRALRFVAVNRAYARRWGAEPEAMIGRRSADFAPAASAARFDESDSGVLATGEVFEAIEEFEGLRPPLLVRKCRVGSPGGDPHVAGFVFDLSESRQREREAEEARRQLAGVLDSMPAGIIIYDRDDRLVLANRLIQEMLPGIAGMWRPGSTLRGALLAGRRHGYFRRSGDPETDGMVDTDPEAWVERYIRLYHRPHAVWEREHPDGRWFQVFDKRTPDGMFIGVRLEITGIKEREAELREARRRAELGDRVKGEFLANMSHEIRTPMNGVLGMAELLARTDLDGRQRAFVDIIGKSGKALLTIINDILDFSKIDAGEMKLDAAPFDLAEAIGDVAALLSPRAEEKNLELVVRTDPSLPPRFVGDVGRFRQVVTNLVGNALKFTEAGHVLVDVSGERLPEGDGRTSTCLTVCVTDTGIGIPADKLAHVFEKFAQVDSSPTRRHEGTGLGLAITARLVELMGGTIAVRSVEGRGSTFSFEVTLPDADAGQAAPAAPLPLAGMRVLIVDDSPVSRAALLEQAKAWGADACGACGGTEALGVLAAAASLGLPVHCAVLDQGMPGMTGLDLAARIRAVPSIAQTPLVLLTSMDEAALPPASSRLAFVAKLIKPARATALRQAVSSAVGELPVPHPAQGRSRDAVRDPGRDPGLSEAAPAVPARASDHRIDILIAEDNEVNQLVFTQILAATPFAFQIVGNGRLAVEAFRDMNPRVILMDIAMPEMNGMEASQAIRRIEGGIEGGTGGRVPIVGVTAHAQNGDRERCLAAGMDDHLPKPVSPRTLLQKVERWIGQRSRGRNGAG